MEISDLKIGTIQDNSYLQENEENSEVKAVLYYDEIYWILITNNPKGIFRVDDGYNSEYTNDLQNAVLILTKFVIENN